MVKHEQDIMSQAMAAAERKIALQPILKAIKESPEEAAEMIFKQMALIDKQNKLIKIQDKEIKVLNDTVEQLL